jgi:two-component system, OmpR family, response regulator
LLAEEKAFLKILIAEDDPTIRQMMVTFLSRKHIDCTMVENGLNAVELWEKDHYDFILMDVRMPVMDGLTAARLIREKERERGGHTVIIALTAHAMASDTQKCYDAGMDEYISKPIDFALLLSLFDGYLQKQ